MLPLKKIVCPTDFSEPADEGLKIARELATQFSAEMLLVHIVAPLPAMHGGVAPTGFHIPAVLEELEGSAKNSLEEIRREKLPAEIKARTFVILGRPAHEIVALAEQEKQEPVAIVDAFQIRQLAYELPTGTKLYAAPVSAMCEWVDLTDDEIEDAVVELLTRDEIAEFRAVIAVFKEKNK